jgi:hypothetical protein
MPVVAIRLDPAALANPDLDIRYVLPDLLTERSAGLILDDGYDYAGSKPYLALFLKCNEVEPAVACIVDVIEHVRVLDNDLRTGAAVGIRSGDGWDVVYPRGFDGEFIPTRDAAGHR